MIRQTKQRKVLQDIFLKENRPLGVEEILSLGREQVTSLNQATVYRNLKLMVEEGWLERLAHEAFGTLYERADKEHHHHFLCRSCNRAFDLPGCALDHDNASLSGFQVENHEIYLFGICPSCSTAA